MHIRTLRQKGTGVSGEGRTVFIRLTTSHSAATFAHCKVSGCNAHCAADRALVPREYKVTEASRGLQRGHRQGRNREERELDSHRGEVPNRSAEEEAVEPKM